jgi:hypothetical protein
MESNRTLQAITAIVTTRGLGFSAAQIYFQSSAQRNPVYCNIYAFYRVNLAMFETRLFKNREIQKAPLQHMDEVYDVPHRPEFFLVTHTVKAYPDQVGRIIRAIGPIEDGDEYYVPAAARNERNQFGRIMPQSEHVLLSNLREYVEALSSPETAAVTRETFYQNNPIPGATWEGPEGDRLLANPDEIMPEDYTADDLRDDVDEYNRMFSWMQKKVPKFVCTAWINYEDKGDRSVFVSNAQENARIIDRHADEPLPHYYSRLKITGKIEELNRALILVGEQPSLANYIYPMYCSRDIRTAGWNYNTDWKGIRQIL